ncbi:alpha/beta fold hydrolase [Sorangium sp. So ce394]|uniref:alpha/beta fold hydrolase n=1 Tax=Sorangium sp. So ce394 TaxID=3133310 RepID=UPI003F5C8078
MSKVDSVVLVHGAWHSPACWSQVACRLLGAGLDVRAPALPSAGLDAARLGGLAADVEAVRAALAEVPGKAVVVAHSYGGLPVTEVAARTGKVAHLVYLCAFQLGPGESLLSSIGGKEPPWCITSADGLTLQTADARNIFYNDCADEVAAVAEAALLPQARASFVQPLSAAAWQELPSTYVICERDNAIPVFAQEAMSQRARQVRRLDAGHSPFLSRPDDVVALVRDIVAAS